MARFIRALQALFLYMYNTFVDSLLNRDSKTCYYTVILCNYTNLIFKRTIIQCYYAFMQIQ